MAEAKGDTVRQLTESGVDRFRDYLKELREGGTADPPGILLMDPEASEPFALPCRVDQRVFPTRLELARYLNELLGGIAGLEEDVGLWSWLSLYYFDQVCPLGRDGSRQPGRDYRHILEPGYPHGHRHLLAGPFLVYRLHKEEARALLWSRIHRENQFHHELASRQALLANPTIIGAVNRLYLDARTGRPKRGAHDTERPQGTLRRFIDVVQQLDLNYDLYSMSVDALLGLLPEEFDAWKRKRRFWSRGRGVDAGR